MIHDWPCWRMMVLPCPTVFVFVDNIGGWLMIITMVAFSWTIDTYQPSLNIINDCVSLANAWFTLINYYSYQFVATQFVHHVMKLTSNYIDHHQPWFIYQSALHITNKSLSTLINPYQQIPLVDSVPKRNIIRPWFNNNETTLSNHETISINHHLPTLETTMKRYH